MVKRVKSFYCNPWWEKETLKSLKLDEVVEIMFIRYKVINSLFAQALFLQKSQGPVILKNTPDVCGLLWKVKHLVKITPIKLPDKMPTTDDLNATYLHENGTFSVIPKVDPARVEATEKYANNPKKMTREYLKEVLRLKWLKGL